jgi:hypothetical protein
MRAESQRFGDFRHAADFDDGEKHAQLRHRQPIGLGYGGRRQTGFKARFVNEDGRDRGVPPARLRACVRGQGQSGFPIVPRRRCAISSAYARPPGVRQTCADGAGDVEARSAWRRATSATDAPGAKLSAMIRCF